MHFGFAFLLEFFLDVPFATSWSLLSPAPLESLANRPNRGEIVGILVYISVNLSSSHIVRPYRTNCIQASAGPLPFIDVSSRFAAAS